MADEQRSGSKAERAKQRREQAEREAKRKGGKKKGSLGRGRDRSGLIAGGFVVLILVAVGLLLVLGAPGEAEVAERTPEIDGEQLPPPDGENPNDPEQDPAVGEMLPEVVGEGFDGEEITIEHDGRPKMVAFMAHWCPHCQDEVAELSEWVAEDVPDEVDLITVSTLVDSGQSNHPPSDWFDREGWEAPVIVDDADDTLARHFGLAATPYWVLADDEGRIVQRISGRARAEDIQQAARNLAMLVGMEQEIRIDEDDLDGGQIDIDIGG